MEPLEGIRVVELAVAVQGPAAGGLLADMGADVIKVEPPGGDANRWFRGFDNSLPAAVVGTQFIGVSYGKRSVCVDIHTEAGLELVDRLVDNADIFLSNYREPALKRIGMGYERLSERNPRLIYATANGFGPLGPARENRMSDQYAQARSGISGVTGTPDDPPLTPGAIIGDTGGAMALALGILTALGRQAPRWAGPDGADIVLWRAALDAVVRDQSRIGDRSSAATQRFVPPGRPIRERHLRDRRRRRVLHRIPPRRVVARVLRLRRKTGTGARSTLERPRAARSVSRTGGDGRRPRCASLDRRGDESAFDGRVGRLLRAPSRRDHRPASLRLPGRPGGRTGAGQRLHRGERHPPHRPPQGGRPTRPDEPDARNAQSSSSPSWANTPPR